jgi:hypothetical protein
MKEYKYRGYEKPIKVDDNGNITYRGVEVEKYFHGYTGGSVNGFSYKDCAKQYYTNEMNKIDERIRQEKYREEHKEEFENLTTVDEDLDYFFKMIGEK